MGVEQIALAAAEKYLAAHPELIEKVATSVIDLAVTKIQEAVEKKHAEKAAQAK